MSRLTADGGSSTDGQNLVVDQHRPEKVPAAAHWFDDTPKPGKAGRSGNKDASSY
jgi:hypothetical protein